MALKLFGMTMNYGSTSPHEFLSFNRALKQREQIKST